MDEYAKELIDSYKHEEWESIENNDEAQKKSQEYASKNVTMEKQINIKISSDLMDALQEKALAAGKPLSLFVSSILQRYISGQLAE